MDSNFIETLFGTIARAGGLTTVPVDPSVSFIPDGINGEIVDIKGNEVSWLGLQNRLMQKYTYEYCFPVAAVADKFADFDISGRIDILRLGGKGKDNIATSPYAQHMRALLMNPNPLQIWEEFRGQQIVYKKIFGFCPVLPLIPVGFSEAVSLINIPPWLFGVDPSSKLVVTSKIEDLIKNYVVTLFGSQIKVEPKDLFLLTDSYWQDTKEGLLLPQSKLVGLDMAVSNLCIAMEADNVLLSKKGPLGFISHDAAAVKDSVAGYIPMTKKEKTELQEQLTQYGLTQRKWQYVISRLATKWNPMSFDVKQLGTKETIIASEKAICHRFNLPYVLYEEIDATYANGANAKKAVYEDNVIPNNKKDLEKYNKFFKAAENNCTIVADFSQVAAFQEDEKFKGQAAYAMNQGLQIEWLNNVITLNQWRVARGYDTVIGGDVYFKDLNTTANEPAQQNPAA